MWNLNHIPTFIAVAECRSMSRAAERLFLSQPAVSAQISELERQLGQTLFDRIPRRGVELTAAGEALYKSSVEALTLLDEAKQTMHDLDGLHSGTLQIGASSTTGTYLLPTICGQFRRQHPRLNMSLTIGNTHSMVSRLREREIDLAIIEEDMELTDCFQTPWLQDTIVLLSAHDHPLAGTKMIHPHQLWDHTMVHRELGSGTRAMVERVFNQLGQPLPPGLYVGSIEAHKRAVLANLGIGWLSSLAVTEELASGTCRHIAVEGVTIKRRHYLLHLRHRRLKLAARSFAKFLMDAVGLDENDFPTTG